MRSRQGSKRNEPGRSISAGFKQRASRVLSFIVLSLIFLSASVLQTSVATAHQKAKENSQVLENRPEHPSKGREAPPGPDGSVALDIDELVSEVESNGAAMHKQMPEYTYLLKKTRRILNEQGKATSVQVQGFEAYPVRGEHILIQLTSNGTPLPHWQIQAERRRAGEKLERLEKEEKQGEQTAKPLGGYVGAGVYGKAQGKSVGLSVDPSAFLHSCELSSPRFDRIGDRDMIVLSFQARPGVELPRNKSFISRLVGSIWIDAADKVIARLEAWPAPDLLKPDPAKQDPAKQDPAKQTDAQALSSPEPRLIYQQVRLPDGLWFPNLIRVNSAGDVLLFNGLNWDVKFEFSDYKRFSTTIEDVKIKDPIKQD
jgi:hypothetical protein